MQRMESGKSKSDLALRPAGLANQFLYVHMRVSSSNSASCASTHEHRYTKHFVASKSHVRG